MTSTYLSRNQLTNSGRRRLKHALHDISPEAAASGAWVVRLTEFTIRKTRKVVTNLTKRMKLYKARLAYVSKDPYFRESTLGMNAMLEQFVDDLSKSESAEVSKPVSKKRVRKQLVEKPASRKKSRNEILGKPVSKKKSAKDLSWKEMVALTKFGSGSSPMSLLKRKKLQASDEYKKHFA